MGQHEAGRRHIPPVLHPGGIRAHGFAVLSPVAEIEYKCTDDYDPAGQLGIAWNDPSLNITWGVTDSVLSDCDRTNPPFEALADRLPVYRKSES
jgi:dTDP-4-dehydrorhamnose 3,5-epimerase